MPDDVERQAAEYAAGERNERQRAARVRAERRERIALHAPAIAFGSESDVKDAAAYFGISTVEVLAVRASTYADALMAKLDKRLQRDLEAAK